MNFEQLFEMQRQLDQHIEEKHGLQQERLVERKILALLVEVGELANETRCFKFWSVKPPAANETILEEYVDGIHFLLSLGLELKIEEHINIPTAKMNHTLTEQFLKVYECVSHFQTNMSQDTYINMFSQYLILGELLGFSTEDVKRAYVAKNEVNFQRQEQGY
ncbi:dUTP diphosphatase [Priestia abyssalis]|uniref:dUTP diphosphatase n=1 Tax=Priestia abyssalis TaxID=1221450 RepID=UPI00099514D8|nr:dUTP diphosphatase [Priestia abyssalis]